MLALAIEFSRCPEGFAPSKLNSVPGRISSPARRVPVLSRGSTDGRPRFPDELASGSTSAPVASPPAPLSDCRSRDLRRCQRLLRKEVIQPHLPVRLPCYDFTPIADPTFDGSLPRVGPPASGVTNFRGVTGGVYKARERIHRGVADPRLLATPTSRGRVADPDPNLACLFGIRSPSRDCYPL